MKKIIGVTPSITKENTLKIDNSYCENIYLNGAIPFVLSYYDSLYIDDIIEKIDGLLLSGGGDINSKFFDQPLDEKADLVLPIRDDFEIAICRAAIAKGIPILGICRGAQVLNVALGGDLNQHIENHLSPNGKKKLAHDITIYNNTLLFDIFKTNKIRINSLHHQSNNKIANGFIVSAVSDDGIIECIEKPDSKFVLGVQWHPECLQQYELFQKFIEAIEIK